MEGLVFNLQKFCVNDGPGIRTTVFLKGCPLNCLWCHNPESKSSKRELMFNPRLCTLCGKCAYSCKNKCHSFSEKGHILKRDNCSVCFQCAERCLTGALEISGEYRSAEEVVAEAEKDRVFYENSGGGITLSGGEPLYQFDFAIEILSLAKNKGLHTCIETCGFVKRERIKAAAELVDIFLYDIKLCDSEEHKKYTGVDNALILDNLHYLDSVGKSIVLRCPVIPGINDTKEHFEGIGEIARSLKNLLEVHVEPYHPLGAGKAKLLGKEYPLEELSFPENSTVEGWISQLQALCPVKVKKA
ncbi:MAG: glycyl-radical enzyme activating protein [Ruminococcaceae bacterium]|nr:glycyl-radical enzyme activating protein [Oscillospiraceae bacterium]